MTDPVLRLYIAGTSPNSRRAEQQLSDIRAFINTDLTVEVIDVFKNPELADRAGILATPTLAYEGAGRPRRIVGDLGNVARVLEFLGLKD